jgi:hypothetical protein
VVQAILCKVYEPLAILIHGVGPLLKVQELLLFAVHEDIRDVVSPKSLMKYNPRHLVVREGYPPSTHVPAELLGHKQHLLRLQAAEKTKLRLGHVKPAIDL